VAGEITIGNNNQINPFSMRYLAILFFLFGIILSGCKPTHKKDDSPALTIITDPPQWAREAIWYQLFVERFRNGDQGNDPTAEDLLGAYPGYIPKKWKITPWTTDWYAPDPWFKSLHTCYDWSGNPIHDFNQKVQLRRYGGDLQGVMDQIDYLDSLGINAVYFNPLNDAPSLHKYDARNWRHIDRNFGPDPKGDVEKMAQENPIDPGTWQMTAADQLFLRVVQALHQKGIRVILDYSWNHTGLEFWAFRDILKKGATSPYKDWYWIDTFDDPATPVNEFSYRGWLGVFDLPEIKETIRHTSTIEALEGNIFDSTAKQHIFNVTQRWLDPNGDGNPSDGVDGFRLDVAAEVPLGFWREYRSFVRKINPEAYLTGEVWWEKYPDHLLDPQPFLQGDIFDAVMNYRWYREARHFFAEAPDRLSVTQFAENLTQLTRPIPVKNNQAMMNVAASHDTPRLPTSLFNDNKYKFQAKPADNPTYKIHKPDTTTIQTQKLLLIHQFTWIGAPHIWAGDEMGMWGADDPDTRKPLLWPDLQFEPEKNHPLNLPRPTDQPKFDRALFRFYRQLTHLRKKYPVLSYGETEFILQDDSCRTLGYSRFNGRQEIIAVFNTGSETQSVTLPVKFITQYHAILQNAPITESTKKTISLCLKPRTAAIIVGGSISQEEQNP